jgi:hypothetical protein
MSRLPTPGADNGAWGDVLNDFLLVSHASGGTLKANSVDAAAITDGVVSNAKLDGATQTTLSQVAGKYVKPGSGIPSSDMTSAVQTSLGKADNAVQVVNGGGETYSDAGNSGAALSINLANGNVQKLTLTANCTLTLTSPATGAMRSVTLLVFQDATGSRTITWPGTVKWGTAGAPTLTTTASKMDLVSLFTIDGGTNWYGVAGAQGF